jgi:hypothetical protein
MNLVPRVAIAAMLALAGSPLLPACSTPRTPEAPEADGGALTCDERLRAQALCQGAIRQRCDSRLNDCEASCEPGALPSGNQGTAGSLSATPFVGDVDVTRCHDNCRQAHEGCVHSITLHCPAKCEEEPIRPQ